ncbi:30S ribosomal protein S9 [Candidatus Pacearchaeota archaeon]|nr:30S ribosomal protein S9 [Candidatus Pacearchaeota archaeon]
MTTQLRASGKRKTSVAKIRVIDGEGVVSYNKVLLENLKMFHKLSLLEPVRIYEEVVGKIPYDIYIQANGGGKESQIQAARLAIAKALVSLTKKPELKEAYLKYDRHMLIADVRRKEQRKPGDSKARAKRQKSYR